MNEPLVGVILAGPHPTPWVEEMEYFLPEGQLVVAYKNSVSYSVEARENDRHWYVPFSAIEILGPL